MNGRISNYSLMELCKKNNWFTCGSCEQYEELFEMNANGAPIEHIATVIWICSDRDLPKNCRRDIILELNTAGFTERNETSEKEHLSDWLGI